MNCLVPSWHSLLAHRLIQSVPASPNFRRFINILLNNCEYVNDRLTSEKRYQDACRDPTMASGLELKKQFVAPLAKKVRGLGDGRACLFLLRCPSLCDGTFIFQSPPGTLNTQRVSVKATRGMKKTEIRDIVLFLHVAG